MSAIVSCPECRRALQVPEEFYGKKVQCPDCKQMFIANPPADDAAGIQIAPVVTVPAPTALAPLPPRDESGRDDEDFRRDREDDDDLDDLRAGARLHSGEPERGAIILTLGIVSLVLAIFSFMLYIVPIWLVPLGIGIVGWIMGQRDLRAFRTLGRRHQQSTNYVLTLIGMILSIVGVGVSVCVMLLACVIYVFFAVMIGVAANAPPPPAPRR